MHLITTICIQAAPQQIWQAMFDPQLLAQCMPGLAGWQELEPQQSYRLLMAWGTPEENLSVQVPVVVNWKDPSPYERIGWEATMFLGNQTLGLEGNILLEPDGAGVNVTLETRLDAPSPVFSQMGNQVAPKVLQPFLKRLRARLEGRATNED